MEKENIFLFVLIIITGFLSYLVLKSQLAYILAGIILAFVSYPVYKFIKKIVRNHTLSAFIVILMLLSLIVVPAIYAGKVLYVQSANIISKVGEIDLNKLDVTDLELTLQKYTGQNIDIKQKIRESIVGVAEVITRSSISFAGKLANFALGIFIMFFIIFYLYNDGEGFVRELKALIPMKKEHKEYLFEEMGKVTKAVLVGILLTAIIQGLIAALGFYLFGYPNALFWGLLCAILYIIPIVGPFLIFIPMGIYSLSVGDYFSGIGILLYGIIILNNTDNFIRPKLVSMQTKIHPAIILIGLIGGLYMMGLVGLFIGPLILSLFLALLEVYANKSIIYDRARIREAKIKKKEDRKIRKRIKRK